MTIYHLDGSITYTYTVGVLRQNVRPLIRSDGKTVALVDSDAGPALIGEMSEKRARRKFPEAFA